MNTLVLEIKYGGLGDHLFYSHIPRIAKTSGSYQRVMLSDQSQFRHPDYRKLVWECNPYFDGFTEENGVYPEFATVPSGENLLDRIMLSLGLDDGLRWHEPELYYQTKQVPKLYDLAIYDPNYVSYVGDFCSSDLYRYLGRKRIHLDAKMKLREFYVDAPVADGIIDTPNLEDFCDLIVSCGNFYCLSSGAATLAAALGKSAVVFWGDGQNPMFHHSRLHRYIKIKESLACRLRRSIGRRWKNFRPLF